MSSELPAHPCPRARFQIPRDSFKAWDLCTPLDLGRRFDLAMCVEVVEHMPAASAATLLHTLVRHADVVVFSAAIPGQPGTHHVNCRWPSYCAEHTAPHHFTSSDAVRRAIWTDREAAAYYRQSMVVFTAVTLPRMPRTAPDYLDVVHPQGYAGRVLTPLWKKAERRLRSCNIRNRFRAQLRHLAERDTPVVPPGLE